MRSIFPRRPPTPSRLSAASTWVNNRHDFFDVMASRKSGLGEIFALGPRPLDEIAGKCFAPPPDQAPGARLVEDQHAAVFAINARPISTRLPVRPAREHAPQDVPPDIRTRTCFNNRSASDYIGAASRPPPEIYHRVILPLATVSQRRFPSSRHHLPGWTKLNGGRLRFFFR